MYITQSNTLLSSYDYTITGDTTIIYVRKHTSTETVTDEETGDQYDVYYYEENNFTIPTGEISEQEIANNIDYYLTYATGDEFTIADRITAIEEVLDFILMGEEEEGV